jgi:hypothetical protein
MEDDKRTATDSPTACALDINASKCQIFPIVICEPDKILDNIS